jgi:hypothetical protein
MAAAEASKITHHLFFGFFIVHQWRSVAFHAQMASPIAMKR